MYYNEKLIELRRERKLTQTALAKIIGVSPRTISAYERNTRRPSLANAIAIAKFFGVDAKDLFKIKAKRE